MPYRIVHKDPVVQADILAIVRPLQQFNLENGPPPGGHGVVLTVEDEEGNIAGGLFGKCGYGWMFVEFLVTPADARGEGLGTKLLQQAEDLAASYGCTGVWLTTMAFQARPFYEKLGYAVFGELPDFPAGYPPHVFLQKRLTPRPLSSAPPSPAPETAP